MIKNTEAQKKANANEPPPLGVNVERLVSWLERHKVKKDLFPGCFDFIEMWQVNSSRCGGKFNLLFFWLYPIGFVFAIPYTILCLIEAIFTGETSTS